MNTGNGDAQAVIDAVERLAVPQNWSFTHPQRDNETVRIMLLPTRDGMKAVSVKPLLDEYLDRPEIIDGKAKPEA